MADIVDMGTAELLASPLSMSMFRNQADLLAELMQQRRLAADLITRLRAENEEAATYAERLAVSLHAKHHADNKEWRPLSGDLIGLLTQIDNMAAGLVTRAEAFERAAQIAESADVSDTLSPRIRIASLIRKASGEDKP